VAAFPSGKCLKGRKSSLKTGFQSGCFFRMIRAFPARVLVAVHW